MMKNPNQENQASKKPEIDPEILEEGLPFTAISQKLQEAREKEKNDSQEPEKK